MLLKRTDVRVQLIILYTKKKHNLAVGRTIYSVLLIRELLFINMCKENTFF